MRHLLVTIGALCLGAALGQTLLAEPLPPELFSELRWRGIGPFRGGWSTCVEGVPGRPDLFYFGAAVGGVWRSDDAGRTWDPLFQNDAAASVAALAIAPSNPMVLYVGTGQTDTRYHIASAPGPHPAARAAGGSASATPVRRPGSGRPEAAGGGGRWAAAAAPARPGAAPLPRSSCVRGREPCGYRARRARGAGSTVRTTAALPGSG